MLKKIIIKKESKTSLSFSKAWVKKEAKKISSEADSFIGFRPRKFSKSNEGGGGKKSSNCAGRFVFQLGRKL